MQEIIEFTILGQPVGKYVKSGRNGLYNSESTKEYYKRVKSIFKSRYPFFTPLDCALVVDYIAFYPIPKSWSKKKQELARNNEIKPTVKPDCDNISKIFDCLNKIAFRDDAVISTLFVDKFFSMIPRVEVTIKEWRYDA